MFKLKQCLIILLLINKQFTFETYEISTLYNVQWQVIPLLQSTVFKLITNSIVNYMTLLEMPPTSTCNGIVQR